MTRLVHLTDLHFGLHHAELVAGLAEAVRASAPDLVVASGDLTQRALTGQFAEAMGFLRGLGGRLMVVPGNHDMPLYNPFDRVFRPFRAFRAGASEDLAPMFDAGGLRLFGTNTAAPFLWRGGVARPAEIDRICGALRAGPAGVTNILVGHHPWEEPPGFDRDGTRGAAEALRRLAAAGLHVALSGHLHHWTIGLGITAATPRPVLQLQTGTALCARPGERDHGFAVLDFADRAVTVTPWLLDTGAGTFRPTTARHFRRHDDGWRASGQAAPSGTVSLPRRSGL